MRACAPRFAGSDARVRSNHCGGVRYAGRRGDRRQATGWRPVELHPRRRAPRSANVAKRQKTRQRPAPPPGPRSWAASRPGWSRMACPCRTRNTHPRSMLESRPVEVPCSRRVPARSMARARTPPPNGARHPHTAPTAERQRPPRSGAERPRKRRNDASDVYPMSPAHPRFSEYGTNDPLGQ